MTTFLRHRLWPAIALLIALTVVTGFVYPVVVTAVAQVAFPSQANGSFIRPPTAGPSAPASSARPSASRSTSGAGPRPPA